MSQKANPTLIGLFILIGVALGVTGLLLFGSSKLFSHTREFILYFDETLNGLNEGAPVKYRGVTIGSVKKVMIHSDQARSDFAMPVIIQLEESLIEERMGDQSELFSKRSLDERIKRGMRASLKPESLVTGVLYIEIQHDPTAPPPVFHQIVARYPEIPTEPTQIQQLMQNLASLDIKSIETNLNLVLSDLGAAVNNLQLAQIRDGLTNLVRSLDRLVSSPEITNDLVAIGKTLDEYKLLGQKLNTRIDPLADSLTNSLVDASRALAQFRGAAENIRTLVAPDAPLRNNLDMALQQLAGALQSFAVLADFLKQHPNALITGRETPERPK
jgi:paraquat-inducible protein B